MVRNALGRKPVEYGAVSALTPREIKSRENDECVGGLRNPNCWVARGLSAQALGLFHRRIVNLELQQQPREIDRSMPSSSTQFGDSARHRLVEDGRSLRVRGYDADCQSGDLEIALPGWLREGFPLGIERVIETVGSSQQLRPTRQQWRQA